MGLHKKIETPEEFLSLFYEYKKQREDYTITVPHATNKGVLDLKIHPPLTWASFDAWLFEKKIITDTEDYRLNRDDRYGDFGGVIRAIGNIIYQSKFDGAVVGLYKENIIARDLGLTEKKEVSGGLKLGKEAFKDEYD